MGTLRCARDDRRLTLGRRALVGRSTTAALRLDDGSVSAEHASVYWHHGEWQVRDLGSTNGTFVEGQRLAPGQKRRIDAGAELRFGGDDPALVWTLEEAEAPIARARRVDGAISRAARGDLLLLPDGDEPLVSIFCDEDGRWVSDAEGDVATVEDQQVVRVASVDWRLELPPTRADADVSTTVPRTDALRSLDACAMEIRVSRDEEFVEIALRRGPEVIALPPRAFHYTLLTLARKRIDDEALPPAERGWIYADDLAKALATTKPKLNLDVCRARQQLAELGIEGAGRLVQRRRTSHQLRLGLGRVSVTPIA